MKKLYLHCTICDIKRAALVSLQVSLPCAKSCLTCNANKYLKRHIKKILLLFLWSVHKIKMFTHPLLNKFIWDEQPAHTLGLSGGVFLWEPDTLFTYKVCLYLFGSSTLKYLLYGSLTADTIRIFVVSSQASPHFLCKLF